VQLIIQLLIAFSNWDIITSIRKKSILSIFQFKLYLNKICINIYDRSLLYFYYAQRYRSKNYFVRHNVYRSCIYNVVPYLSQANSHHGHNSKKFHFCSLLDSGWMLIGLRMLNVFYQCNLSYIYSNCTCFPLRSSLFQVITKATLLSKFWFWMSL